MIQKNISALPEFRVCIRCITFNHSRYIVNTMDGFCMQQTTFPFVCTIVDDASTDGEQIVIDHYLNQHFLQENELLYSEDTQDYRLIFTRHRRNTNCYYAVYYLKYNHYSIKKSKEKYFDRWNAVKYIALCEGDDYWITPNKLQMQVDFMESEPTCMLCFHRSALKEEMIHNIHFCLDMAEDRDYNINELFDRWLIPTASIVVRKEVFNVKLRNRHLFISGDDILYYSAAEMGTVHGFSNTMSVYRIHDDSISRSKEKERTRALAYPYHYINIYRNFKTIEKKRVKKKIAILFLNCIQYHNSPKDKIKDLYHCMIWDYSMPFILFFDKLRVKMALKSRFKLFFCRP